MNNRGQTTIFFSLIISALLIFTLSALELGRIYMSQVKVAAVVQSTKESIMADYNRELFERYHLLFADPTYGTGSEAIVEEKISDYIATSLQDTTGQIYEYDVEEICVVDEKNVLDHDMKRLKEQIEEYEKTEGIVHRAKEVANKVKGNQESVKDASVETEENAIVKPIEKESPEKRENTEDNNKRKSDGREESSKVEDPRDSLKDALKFGLLTFIKPEGMDISKSEFDFSESPSKLYKENRTDDDAFDFEKIDFLKTFLKRSAEEKVTIMERAALLDYADYHFSNGVKEKENCVMKCEMEYILKGKKSDYENMEAVLNEMIRTRMPVNYAYLLSDQAKKGEALTMATAICAATNTEALIDVVKYLLLGCWAYGETLCEMKDLLRGEKIPYIKNVSNWKTELKAPTVAKNAPQSDQSGISYNDFLLILLGKKSNSQLNMCYGRMLDVIEKNMQQTDKSFQFKNYVYQITFQGKTTVNSLYVTAKDSSLYDYYFEEQIEY